MQRARTLSATGNFVIGAFCFLFFVRQTVPDVNVLNVFW